MLTVATKAISGAYILDPNRDLLGWDVDTVVERRYQDFVQELVARMGEMEQSLTTM